MRQVKVSYPSKEGFHANNTSRVSYASGGSGHNGPLGPLPETDDGNKYVLVAVDYFTRWTEAYGIRNQEAATVAKKLVDKVFCRFSPPEQLHSGKTIRIGLNTRAVQTAAGTQNPHDSLSPTMQWCSRTL